jgi:predicted HicB family RNase H-like nuclease
MSNPEKPKNDRAYTLRMPEDLYKKVARRAIDEGKRVNEFVNDILQRALEDEGRKACGR